MPTHNHRESEVEMTKQEEIREGMKSILIEGGLQEHIARFFVKKLSEYQSSQGVVIKVGEELPDGLFFGIKYPVKNARYVAVEPLIEGE